MTRGDVFTRSAMPFLVLGTSWASRKGPGSALQWFRNRLAQGLDYDELTAEATLSPAGRHGLFWLPYLMGERTPHLDAAARGSLRRLDGKACAGRPGARNLGGRLLQPEGRTRNRPVARGRTGHNAAFRGRCEESFLASAVCRYLRYDSVHVRNRRRLGLWRGAAGHGRNWRIRECGGDLFGGGTGE